MRERCNHRFLKSEVLCAKLVMNRKEIYIHPLWCIYVYSKCCFAIYATSRFLIFLKLNRNLPKSTCIHGYMFIKKSSSQYTTFALYVRRCECWNKTICRKKCARFTFLLMLQSLLLFSDFSCKIFSPKSNHPCGDLMLRNDDDYDWHCYSMLWLWDVVPDYTVCTGIILCYML